MKELTELVQKLYEQKAVCENMDERLKAERKKLEGLKLDCIKSLEAAEIDKYSVPGFGSVFRQKKYSVKVPKSPDDKLALFKYISKVKGEDVLFNLQTIHSATLNSFYKEEREDAIAREDINWALPGVAEPDIYFTLGTRKA